MKNSKTSSTIQHAARLSALVFWLVITIVPILGIIFSITNPISFYATQEQYRDFISHYRSWAPLVFILIQAVQVIVTPLSHYSVGYMGGYLFGPLWGSIYNYVGRLIGHMTAFLLSRFLATPLVKRLVPESTITRYNQVVSNRADILFLAYFLPLFPDDELSYLVGISKMPTKWFIIANIFGHLGGSISLAYLGSGINTKDPVFWILTIVTLAGFPVLWLLARKHPVNTETDGSNNG